MPLPVRKTEKILTLPRRKPARPRELGRLGLSRGNFANASWWSSPDFSTTLTLPFSGEGGLVLCASFLFLVATKDIMLACVG